MEQVQLEKVGPVEGLVGVARQNRPKNRILTRVQRKIGTLKLPVADVPAEAVAGAKAVQGAVVVCSGLEI
jgi:hypothetical protein